MKTIQITKENYEAALRVANEETRKVLIKLFGDSYPTLDDYKTIKSYEDACIALGEMEQGHSGLEVDEIAYLKLKTISRALWGRNFKPAPDATGNKIYHYPWFSLYNQGAIDKMTEEEHSSLLFRRTDSGALAGFGLLSEDNRASYSLAITGFRLCQETPEKAKYFGKQFIELWADYLVFSI